MGDRIKPILGAAGITLVLNYIGVTYFFDPQAGTELIAAPLSLVVAGAQILMVDFYYVINGTRDMASAAISAVILLVGWYAAATVYQKLS